MQKVKKYILIVLGVALVLTVAFFAGKNGKSEDNEVKVMKTEISEDSGKEKGKIEESEIIEEAKKEENLDKQKPDDNKTATSKEESESTPVLNQDEEELVQAGESTKNEASDNKTEIVSTPEPTIQTQNDEEYTCTISVRCDTILNNMNNLAETKKEFVPEDGVIFAPRKVVFYEGESVFNVLRREMKANKIHMEFEQTPMYNSAYIEGIANLYEFDCGELSGWMYRVNGEFPNYGCSKYQLKDGDIVEWIYTCDLGDDIGGRAQQWQEE